MYLPNDMESNIFWTCSNTSSADASAGTYRDKTHAQLQGRINNFPRNTGINISGGASRVGWLLIDAD